MDAKTELLVWIIQHRPHSVTTEEAFTDESSSRTQVTFKARDGEYVVDDWRMTFPSHELQFAPHYAGLFLVGSHCAKRVIELERENAKLMKRRAKIQREMADIDKSLGLTDAEIAALEYREEIGSSR